MSLPEIEAFFQDGGISESSFLIRQIVDACGMTYAELTAQRPPAPAPDIADENDVRSLGQRRS